MKQFLIMLKHEYNGMFLPLCIILAILAVLQFILFGYTLNSNYTSTSFSYLVDSSRIYVVFAVAYAGLLVVIVVRLIRGYMPSTSSCAQLTLPVNPEHVYLAKLGATTIAGFMLVATQLILVLLVFVLFQIFGQNADLRNADLFLSSLESGYLRLLFPLDLFSLAFTLLGFLGTICVVFFVAAKLKCREIIFPIILTAVWAVLLIRTFPLGNYTLFGNIVALAIMLVVTIVATVSGADSFEYVEVEK